MRFSSCFLITFSHLITEGVLQMTKTEMNRLTMFRAARAVMNTFVDFIQTIPALKTGNDKFSTALGNLESIYSDHQTIAKGTVAEKHHLKSHLAQETDTMCGSLFVYGKKTGDSQLTEITDVTESELGGMRDNILLEKAKTISKTLISLQANLLDYSISEQAVTAFQNLVAEYDKSLNKKDSKGTASVAAREKLTQAFLDVDKVLKEDIDKIIKQARNPNPDFYNQYQQARVIKYYGIRHVPIEETTPTTAG